jgi:hypothetical protein
MRLAVGIHVGCVKPGFTALRDTPLLVLVGVTGVGKSTTLEALKNTGLRFNALPDRREVTDAVIFQGETVTDRAERFARTAAFRTAHPGGMAQALLEISINLEPPLLFDGLRGLDEVSFAAEHLPLARFVALDAPDTVRVARLLGRGDAFDRLRAEGRAQSAEREPQAKDGALERLLAIDGIEAVFSKAEIQQLAELEGEAQDIAAKVGIVVTERRHYDPKSANAFLQGLRGNRVLYADTTLESAERVAARIKAWWTA